MFHTCVRTFDVMGTAESFLGTKQGLNIIPLQPDFLHGSSLPFFWYIHRALAALIGSYSPDL